MLIEVIVKEICINKLDLSISYSKPNCYWVRGNEVYNYYQFKKHKLQNQLNNHFNNKITKNENITLNGFYKIYDCGNLIFEKIY